MTTRAPANVPAVSMTALQTTLSDCLALVADTKHAHWNVKGSDFFQLHELFDRLVDDLTDLSDTVAERLVALGGLARGTIDETASHRTLATLNAELQSQSDLLAGLIERYSDLSAKLVPLINETADAGDPTTSDVLTEASRSVDKARWFLMSHQAT